MSKPARPFIHEDFLLETALARRLFHEAAADQPIIDYHNHLPPAEIAGNRRFENLAEIWLGGDHYKWRAMRADGVAETDCTGDAPPYEKFLAWARTVPHTLRNPLYHWTHLELKRYFDIDELLCEESAPRIWAAANERLQAPDRDVHGILESFRVRVLCTTDDPADDLAAHAAAAASPLSTRVFPSFRPDALMRIAQPEFFPAYLGRLAAAADREITTLAGLVEAVASRHAVFDAAGCRATDHGLGYVPARFAPETEVAALFARARKGETLAPEDVEKFQTYLLLQVGRLNAERGWAMQLHLGALRNNSTRGLRTLGPDTGYDSIGDWPQAERLAAFLDRLDRDGALPRTILYNLNPADNYLFATMIGNFQDGSIPGKLQYGSGWWFLDQLEGMTRQLDALSSAGLLYRFVGMLTDSRSFMSFPRHEYFRRLLCNLLGRDAAAGLVPDDFDLLADAVRRICFANARDYFAFPV